ncbi:MAG: hypothetical protein HQK89_17545 [Nitrospirae bacterium]|nr:hypothetical protein [Nitrospirota bacterium]
MNKVDSESKKELATKSDLVNLKTELKADLQLLEIKLESKLRLYFLILAFLIILTNPKALDLLGKLLGLVK